MTPIYRLGETIRLGELDGRPAPAACRFEVIRPDGKVLTRDWDKHGFRVRASQPGIWTWRMYSREGGKTSLEGGELEVILPPESHRDDASGLARLLRQVAGHRGR
jgi:hypothetical protein